MRVEKISTLSIVYLIILLLFISSIIYNYERLTMTESYSTLSEIKHQEYLLEKSLQELNIKEAQSEISEAVGQLSMGPFTFDPQCYNFRVYLPDDCDSMYICFKDSKYEPISKEMFLTEVAGALRDRIKRDYPERREVDRGYANLILQLIKDSDVYDRIIEAYEHYYVALKALDEVEKNLQAWDEEMKKLEDSASDTFHIQLDICSI